MADVHPISILIEELQDEDVQNRLNSVKRLSTIALALGEESTRAELLPYLKDQLEDEDEIRLEVASELAKFVPLVGGEAYAHFLIGPLEKLAQIDEIVVRNKAVESLCSVADVMPAKTLESEFVPAVERLARADFFAPRASACGLFTAGYARVAADKQATLRSAFSNLCHDDTPMVRRAAASHLKDLVQVAKPDVVQSEFLPLYNKLVADDQDSVRLLAVGSAPAFLKSLGTSDASNAVVATLNNSSKDRSWKVRNAVAEAYTDAQKVSSADRVKAELVPVLVRLIRDQEAEVRTHAIFQLPNVGADMTPAERQTIVLTNFMAHVADIAGDGNEGNNHVRVALSGILGDLATLLGKDKCQEHLMPLVVKLLKDPYHEVRLNVVSKLGALHDVIGADQLASVVVPQVAAMAKDPQWRVRLALVEQLPLIAGSIGQSTFDSKLLGLLDAFLSDNVYAVREAIVHQLAALVTTFGGSWASKTIVPKLTKMSNESVYLARLTSLFAMSAIVEAVDTSSITKDILPAVLKRTGDSVPNIRFNVAKVLGNIIPRLDASVVSSKVKPALAKLASDSDPDVKHFATIAQE
eukprot:TRINITY_DN8132_c0_g1_i2.p1 TRINITY_DN8132_c0_g1~~TRINITY_DN8132_c0_g1_i2.p1  ORF type:complete len:582 (+),score=168.35 TRINITY_DN8132_c0_g1_i2:142-1887(+)